MATPNVLEQVQAWKMINAIETWCRAAPPGRARVATVGLDETGRWFARLDEQCPASRGSTLSDALAQVTTRALFEAGS